MDIELGKIYAVWLREVKRFTNSKSRVIGSLAMPMLFLVALGGGFSQMIPGFNYGAFILPGVIAMAVLFTSIFAGVSIIWDREFGFLKEMLASPTSRENLVIGRVLGGATTAILQGLIVLVFGSLFLGAAAPPLQNLFGAIVLMTLLSCFCVAVGIAIASIVQEVETFQLIINLVIMPFFFLSNALFPVDKMPEWLRDVALLNPLSYAVDGLRGLITGQASFNIIFDFGLSLVFFVISIAVATYLFSKTSI